MIRAAVIALSLAGLAACADSGGSSRAWYEQGDTTYDALKAGTDACKAKGGDFQLKNGGDPTHMGDYDCVMGKGR